MTELEARRIYLKAVHNAQQTSRRFLDKRRTLANRTKAYELGKGLSHVQKVFYLEWLSHYNLGD